ncbi:MAG TPA: HAD family hydrolase, partial [Polyangia bacterium]
KVEPCLQKLRERADIMVVSATPQEALAREWAEHGIEKYVALIAGQEMGSKTEHLTLAAKGKYAGENILMVGDAPGDFKAARDVGALFYPINPGDEEASWERFFEEGIPKFFSKQYAGAYEAKLITDFDRLLPKDPPWKTAG